MRRRSLPCSQTPSIQSNMRTCSRCWSRWIERIRPFEHWYLPWLGVLPDGQGSGLGGRLLEHGLGIVDQQHLPAYLETPNPRTIRFYERYGFEVTAESRSGSCPPVSSMLRDAR